MKLIVSSAAVWAALSLHGGRAFAQAVLYDPASLWWEASTDNGLTWDGGVVEVPASPRAVLVRAVAEFRRGSAPQEQYRYFGRVYLDVTVSNAGPLDQISRWWSPLNGFSPWATRRFGSTLKLDHELDTSPPGQGTLWLSPGQGHPQTLPNPVFDITVAPLIYELSLDASPGERTVDCVFRSYEPLQLQRWFSTYRLGVPFDFQTYYSPITDYRPLTIRVVPAPGGLSIALVAAGVLAGGRRRRRT